MGQIHSNYHPAKHTLLLSPFSCGIPQPFQDKSFYLKATWRCISFADDSENVGHDDLVFAFCVGGDSKLVGHLLLPCHGISYVEQTYTSHWVIMGFCLEDLRILFMLGRLSTFQPSQGCSGKVGHTIARTIWLERNRRIFKDVIADLDNL